MLLRAVRNGIDTPGYQLQVYHRLACSLCKRAWAFMQNPSIHVLCKTGYSLVVMT